MRESRWILLAALVLAAVASAGAAGCSRLIPPSATPIPPAAAEQSAVSTTTSLGTVEVSAYKGKPLDTVASEPENSIDGPQTIDRSTYRLAVTGEVKTPLDLTYEQVRAMPSYQKVTTLHCVEGWSRTYLWQGVRLRDLLSDAGFDPTASTVIFTSYDGYSTSLPLDFVVGENLLLAYAMNGKEIPPERGWPFQVVAEDRFGYKWAKWVTGIEVSADENYRGYWEQRGYDNDATLPGTK
jgi:DMSO/TMAO reductase YedYZ molybdopterin-dependent catalytic subunit